MKPAYGLRALPRFMISAAHKSSGKTTVATGLAAAFRRRGTVVQVCKKGPDYIDPMWLTAASGRACRNLDPYLQDWSEIGALFARVTRDAKLAIVEGNKGLHDGLALDGSNSSAALAKALGLPVVLVLDARGMTRGIAPLILGQEAFDREVAVGGVILNRVGGKRHEAKLRAVIEAYCDLPVLGAIGNDPRLDITERHLGLVPSNELSEVEARIAAMAQAIEEQVDLDALLALAQSAAPLAPVPTSDQLAHLPARRRLNIGITRDAAFGFYYADDLEALERAGCTLLPFDTLRDARLPEVDGLFLGGGFPESFLIELEANQSLREELRLAIKAGLPVYAECGGLMYLARSLTWKGRSARMVGAIPADAVMHERPVGRGYVHLRETAQHPWPQRPAGGTSLRAHEFHYSSLVNLDPALQFAYEVERGQGIDGRHDGLVYRNVLASYSHRRNAGADHWAQHFAAFVARERLVSVPAAARAGSRR
ncbi:cobyrinic acid a,c-diamide synthase [Burkholderiales bacterium]|nr:cobyrinic acid a,c-diamide synthase [Burkholderiales bacterium]